MRHLWLLSLFFSASLPTHAAVRVGVHDDFSRVVFDFAKKSSYTVTITGNTVQVQFATPVTGTIPPLAQKLAPFVQQSVLSADKKTTDTLSKMIRQVKIKYK